MHVLTKLNVKIGPVLVDAAIKHFKSKSSEVNLAAIDCFILPEWMFLKLSKEEGFVQSGLSYMATWDGFTIFKAKSISRPVMREKGDMVDYEVIKDEE